MQFDVEQVQFAAAGRADPDRYLILGFDTDPSPFRKQAAPISKTIRRGPLQER